MLPIVEKLLASEKPSIRYKIRVNVLGEDNQSPAIRKLREEIRKSPVAQALLSEREGVTAQLHVYRKFAGAHWVLASLADIGYPPHDPLAAPLAELVCCHWLNPQHISSVAVINGKARRCASQEGNALAMLISLGYADERISQLVGNLLRWQWPDGGWNCDKKPSASHSSFWESLIPLRGLSLYARMSGDAEVHQAAKQVAEVFLTRQMFSRQCDGTVMNDEFILLHYPCYWHYDILAGLKVMSEAGFVKDPRCIRALELLESKQLPDGGWPAEARYYRVASPSTSGSDLVSWGNVSKTRMNEWVTADALSVLQAAARLHI